MIQHGNIMHWPPWAERLTRWNHVMLVANSSFNIVIYVFQVLINIKHTIIISFSWSIIFITILNFFHRCMKLFVYLILNCSGLQVPARPVGAHHVPGQPGQGGEEEGEESIFIYLKLLFLYQKVSKLKQTILLSQEIEQQHCLGHNWDNCWAKRNIFSGNFWLIFLMIVLLRL